VRRTGSVQQRCSHHGVGKATRSWLEVYAKKIGRSREGAPDRLLG